MLVEPRTLGELARVCPSLASLNAGSLRRPRQSQSQSQSQRQRRIRHGVQQTQLILGQVTGTRLF